MLAADFAVLVSMSIIKPRLFHSFLPFLPVSWIDLDPSFQFRINPRIAHTTAWENKGMDRPAAVNDCEPHIAVVGNIRRRIDLMPHASEAEHVAPESALI